jgi:hypothetical protein
MSEPRSSIAEPGVSVAATPHPDAVTHVVPDTDLRVPHPDAVTPVVPDIDLRHPDAVTHVVPDIDLRVGFGLAGDEFLLTQDELREVRIY